MTEVHTTLTDVPPLGDLPLDWIVASPGAAETKEQYATARRLLLAFELEPRIEMSPDAVHAYGSAREGLRIAAFTLQESTEKGDVSKQQAAQTFAQHVQANYVQVVQRVRPYLRSVSTDLAEDVADARDLYVRASEAERRWAALEKRAQELVERVGVGSLASFYKTEAESHAASARWWLAGVAAFTAALVALVVWLMHGAYTLPANSDWHVVATQSAAKAIGIGVLSYAITFCSRNYRAQLHLQAAYRQRMASLETYSAMAVALKDDKEDKRIVLVELAKAVFATTDTGLTQSGSGDKTIIEQSIPLGSLLGGTK